MRKALLIGREPMCDLGYSYVAAAPYDGVVIGSLTLSQLLRFDNQQALEALAEGKQVILYTPGLPEAPGNRALSASLASARRELKNWRLALQCFTQTAWTWLSAMAQISIIKIMACRLERP